MNRRMFLRASGMFMALNAAPSLAQSRELSGSDSLLIRDAYSLWYNRPAVAEIAGGFCVGYIKSSGDVCVCSVDNQLSEAREHRLYTFDDASDHGSPTILRIPEGKYAGHVLACFSNHASPLMCARTDAPGVVSSWGAVKIIDMGRSTYAALSALPDGTIILTHTLQERAGSSDATEWRKAVARVSRDGGDTWSAPRIIAAVGPGTFPYCTPVAVSRRGTCAMAYSIYRTEIDRHQGLAVALTSDAFESQTSIELPVLDFGTAASGSSIVPYEIKWLSESIVAVTYTVVSGEKGLGFIALVDTGTHRLISNMLISETETHAYPGGVAVSAHGGRAVCSQPEGGLVSKDLRTGKTKRIVEAGSFSSPSIVTMHGQRFIVALKNPSIVTTRKFSADILIVRDE